MRVGHWARMLSLLCPLLTGCAAATGPSTATTLGPDRPVPAGEPRAELALRLDLEPLRDCEERFDLALYENRAVELVAWDEHHERCERRLAVIRYLARLTDADRLLEAARALALRVERAPSPPRAPSTPAPPAPAAPSTPTSPAPATPSTPASPAPAAPSTPPAPMAPAAPQP